MKKASIYILVTFFSFHLSYSQLYINTEKPKKSGTIENNGLFIGIGTGLGIFYPNDVNEYIKTATSNILTDQEFSDMFVNGVGRLSISNKFNSKFELALVTEFAIATSTIAEYGTDDLTIYTFTRVSPGILSKFYFPIKSGRHAFYIAPGVNYHFMKFEEFEANNFGGKLQLGLSFNFKKFSLQPYMSIDYATATDNSQPNSLELNYSGLQLGFEFHFKFAD